VREEMARSIIILIVIALLNPIFPTSSLSSEDSPYSGRKIDIVMTDADIRDVLLLIGDCAGVNMVIAGNVKGKITLRLIDVPIDQAFDIICEMAGLEAFVFMNTLMVAKINTLNLN
jgi:type IV pilus assembly protein PilQ